MKSKQEQLDDLKARLQGLYDELKANLLMAYQEGKAQIEETGEQPAISGSVEMRSGAYLAYVDSPDCSAAHRLKKAYEEIAITI